MHQKIKYIIAASLVIGAISGVIPTDTFGLGTVKVYAATYTEASKGQLTSLDLTWGGGNEIELRDSYSGDKVDLTEKSDYYVELKGISGFNISAEVKGSGYVVKQFTSADKTEKGKDVGAFDINSGYTKIYLRTYKSEDAYKEAYENGNVSSCEKTYIIYVKKATTSSQIEQDREYAYLSNIHLSDGIVNFSKKETSYDVNIDEALDKITVRATPEEDDDYVEINGNAVYKDDNFEKTINLDKGNNTIKIHVEHEDDDTTYTLNLNRGKVSSTATKTDDTNFPIQSNTSKVNVWQENNGKWRYIDGSGEVLKNQFWFDKNTGINYYLKEDGYRATGWFNNNNNWYYFSENGDMKTGWVNLDKNWYYLNQNGIMKMGWLEDSAGNSYYLDNNGAMKVGWIESSDGKWYYLDSTGKMIKDTTINGSKINSNGVLVN
jgi:glucan-binding YG repeat protein